MCVQIATMYMQDSDSDLLTQDRMKMDEAKFRETGTDRRTGGGGGGGGSCTLKARTQIVSVQTGKSGRVS